MITKYALIFLPVVILLFVALTVPVVVIYIREAIHDAVLRGDVAEIASILDGNPNRLEQKNRMGLTPLCLAVMHRKTDVVIFLLDRGADANSTWDLPRSGDSKWSALHMAARYGNPEIAEYLLQKHAEPNQLTQKLQTPLDFAFNERMAIFLIGKGCKRAKEVN